MPVIYTPHYAQFFDDNGVPLNGGKLYTYLAGTSTPKATYTTAGGTAANANPVILDSSGRATLFLDGSYKFRLEDSLGNLIEETDNITSFSTQLSGSNLTSAINFAYGGVIASTTTTDIWGTAGNFYEVSGTATITSFGEAPQAGAQRIIRFSGSCVLSHGTNIRLPGGINITTAAGDYAIVNAYSTTVADVAVYTKSNGKAVVSSSSNKNFVINGNFDVWQRGTSFANPASVYTADRWFATASNSTLSATTGIYGISTLAAAIIATGATNSCLFAQALESIDCEVLKTKRVTLSFYYSSTITQPSNSLSVALQYNGTPDVMTTGTWTSITPVSGTSNYTPSSTLQRASIVVDVPSGAEGLRINIQTSNTTNGTGVYIQQVQLEAGDVDTGFEFRPIAQEIALCQRYFCKTFNYNVTPATNTGDRRGCVIVTSTVNGGFRTNWVFPQEMRAPPIVISYNPNAANSNWRGQGGADYAIGASFYQGTRQTDVSAGASFAGIEVYFCHFTASAELS